MKKSFIKIMAVSSTALLLGGTFAPVVLAEEATSTTEAPADNSAEVTEAETPNQPEENPFLKVARDTLKEKIANSTLVSTDKEVLNAEADQAKSVEELEAIVEKLTKAELAKADAEASETTEDTEAPVTTEERIGKVVVYRRDSEGKIHRLSDEQNANTEISVSQGDKVLDKTQNDNWFTFVDNTDSNQANDYQYTVTLPAGYKVVTDDVTLTEPYATYAKQLKAETGVFQIVKGTQSYFIAIEAVPEETPAEPEETAEENIYVKTARDILKEKIANSTLVSTDKEVLNAEADEAKSVEELEKIEEKLTQAEQAKSDAEKALALEAAKEKAIAELREAGVTSDFFLNKIREGKTIEGVEALKDELIKSHLDSSKPEEKPEETPEEVKYTVRYELRNKEGEVIEVLQTEEGWTDWSAMETSSIATANKIAEQHGSWDVESYADGLVYVFTAPEETPEPEKVKYTVRYELRNKEGEVIEVLQTEEGWTDWAIMEKSSVVVADKFAEKHGPWDVEAYADGLVYVFTAKEATPEPESSEESSTESSSEDKSTEVKKESKKETKKEEKKEKLPETGEVSSTAIFGAAALAILAGLGLVAPAFKKED